MTKTIGVIGGGVTGKAVARGFMEHAEVRVHDPQPERGTHTAEAAASADVVFVCLPTPAREDGSCDTTCIDLFLQLAYSEAWWRRDSVYVLKSTVPVGFTQVMSAKYLHGRPLLHSPEFLTARCALTDFQLPARNIIGYPLTNREGVAVFNPAINALHALYERRFPGVPIMKMNAKASELVKLACNSFFAAKVSMFNLFADLAAAHDLKWGDVLAGIMSDGRIAHAHTQVPGPDGRAGYGGACLPKDLENLEHCCREVGVPYLILEAVREYNDSLRQEPENGAPGLSAPG
jgi:UDPglucose 6-dehydrogenase